MLESKGWKLFRSGWPDYAAEGPHGEKMFFELKNGNDKVSQQQKNMHTFLESTGTPVYIIGGKSVSLNRQKALNELYSRSKNYDVFVPFQIIRVLQKEPLIAAHIAKRLGLVPQQIAYHLKILLKIGMITRNKEDLKYRLADRYTVTQQLHFIGKLKPFIDEIHVTSKNKEEIAEKIVNYFLIFLSNLFL